MVLGDKGALTSCYLDEMEITRLSASAHQTCDLPSHWQLAVYRS